jgi:ABC-type transporter MlaC component
LRESRSRVIYAGKSTISLFVAGALALPLVARAQAPVDAFVARVTEGIAGIHAQAGGDAAKTLAGCSDFLGRVLNLPAMAKIAGRDAWEKMSAEQRDAYQAAFAKRLAAECARQLASYKGEPVTLAGVRTTASGDRLATVRLGGPENARMIAWQLRGAKDGAKDDALSAVDVIFECHSAMIKAHDDFITVLRAAHGNIDAVIESLRK